MAALGSHSILELYGCPHELLDDQYQVQSFLREAAVKARCQVLGELSHKFEPQGVTALVLLAESHISVHTWPEAGYAAIDVFTCGDNALPDTACNYLTRMFEARRHDLRRLPRGEGMPRLFQERRPVPVSGDADGSLTPA